MDSHTKFAPYDSLVTNRFNCNTSVFCNWKRSEGSVGMNDIFVNQLSFLSSELTFDLGAESRETRESHDWEKEKRPRDVHCNERRKGLTREINPENNV